MKSTISKGFTIIELLIVVAIIAILTGIVLYNVTAWINQSKDASIQANLNSIQTNSAKFLDANQTYDGFCSDSSYITAHDAIANISATTQTCNTTVSAFCACSTLKVTAGNVFCVDSTGIKKTVSSTDCATECDASAACQ